MLRAYGIKKLDLFLGFCLHDVLGLPNDCVGVEVLGGVKPKVELLFSAASALGDDIGMEDVRFAGDISEELKIYFIVGWSLSR